MTIPCYVSGKGMHATDRTKQFKIEVIQILEMTGLGFDTRYRYYRKQFPDMVLPELARRVCGPIEHYDRDWPGYLAAHGAGRDEDEIITAFILARDALFRCEAQAAIYCYDEAGFGSGLNTMRFILEGKPLLGFYNPAVKATGLNVHNVLQLKLDYPDLVTLVPYHALAEVRPALVGWLHDLQERHR
jgi:hypothetical protein